MPSDARSAIRVRIFGRVQGVGFRPFLHRLATLWDLKGWVKNRRGTVLLHLEGLPPSLDAFLIMLREDAPPAAAILALDIDPCQITNVSEFTILPSDDNPEEDAGQISPDFSVCQDCYRELHDPLDRRYRYPFTSCTQCGPRYTVVEGPPLDREKTAMRHFPMCQRCRVEYGDPLNRRFHAQMIACPECGPKLHYTSKTMPFPELEDPLVAGIRVLKAGGILAIRGVGGYHLACDACSPLAIQRLRTRKRRPHKPLAIMVANGVAESFSEPYRTALQDPVRPVVLVPKTSLPPLNEAVAPGLSEIGILLPDSPLHVLIAEDFGGALVMTSANVSGQPMILDPEAAERDLGDIADGFLHHDRPILRSADDAVRRQIGGAFRPIRLGRGDAPLILEHRSVIEGCLLAVGGDLKNTVALASGNRVIVSPHLGDLGSARNLDAYEKGIMDLSGLLGLTPDRVVCDAHPDYRSARFAESLGLPLRRVAHHHAHASGLFEESRCQGDILVFAFDGLGYGEDGGLWGGEAFSGRPGAWHRIASLRPLKLPGGDKASREPWRIACVLAAEEGLPWPLAPKESDAIVQALSKGIPTPEASSMGRLLDGAAALTGVCLLQSYEGQAAMMLEAMSYPGAEPLDVPWQMEGGLRRWDFRPLIPRLLDASRSPQERGAVFHASLAQMVTELACWARSEIGISVVGLTGGVFQNNLLVTEIQARLQDTGMDLVLHRKVPSNDAGLCFGQIVEAEAIRREKMCL